MSIAIRWQIVLVAGSALLSSCAINALRVETGRDVAATAKVAVTATRTYLDRVEEARMTASLDLIGLDANCVDRAYLRTDPQLTLVRDIDRPPRGWLCTPRGGAGTYPTRLVIGPIAEELEPTLALVDALGAYGAAISKIVDAKAPDPTDDLLDALKLARSAEGLLRAGFGGDAIVPAASDKRLTAVTGLIDLLARLADEQDKVRRFRLLTEERAVGDVLTALRDHLAAWEISRRSNANLSYVVAGTLYGQSTRIDPPLPSAVRRNYAAAFYSARGPLIAGARVAPALDRSLRDLADEDRRFRETLRYDPHLTDAQKDRLAALTRDRLIEIFDTLTAFISAAKGV